MPYYHSTWTHDSPDDPVWMAYEVTDERNVVRLIEHFALGWTDYREAAQEECVSLLDRPFEPSEADLDPTVTVEEITAEAFEALWSKSGV